MLAYFWSYEADIPAGMGTPNFGPVHFGWIAASVLLIMTILLIYRRQSQASRLRMQKALVLLIVILELSHWLWAAIIGHYNVVEMLPLHLCSITVWAEVAGVFSGRTMLKEFGYALGLPGALASVLTPDWYAYPFLSYQYLQAALGHTLLVLIPVLWVWGDGFRPDYRRLPKLFALLVLYAIPVALINLLLGSNYLFLCAAPKDTPLELFENWFGNPGYLLPLAALIFVIWAILYLPWVIRSRSKTQA